MEENRMTDSERDKVVKEWRVMNGFNTNPPPKMIELDRPLFNLVAPPKAIRVK